MKGISLISAVVPRLVVSAMLIAGLLTVTNAQSESPSDLIKAGKAADQANNFAESVASFERAIALDPHNTEAHLGLYSTKNRQIIRSFMPSDGQPMPEGGMDKLQEGMRAFEKEQTAKYQELEKRFPDKAAYKLLLSRLSIYDPVKSLGYLEAANTAEPSNLEVLTAIAQFESSRGNSQKAGEYYTRILTQRPDDKLVNLLYLLSLKEYDKAKFKRLTLEFVDRNAPDRTAMQALSILIYDTADSAEAITYYQKLRKLFPPEKPDGAINQLTGLFAIYNQTDPAKALELAEELVKIAPSESAKKTWQSYADYQSAINQATALTKDGKFEDALSALAKAKAPRYFDNTSTYQLAKAEAQDYLGRTSDAYDELSKFYVENPRRNVRSRLEILGKKIGKSKEQVEKDVQSLVVANSKPFKDFSLTRFDTGKKVSLADFRGKVVFLSFWYPLCGPCHQEAPFLQKLTEKYGKDGFVILAVNGHPKEDSLVMPYFEKTKHNFIPLQVPDEEFVKREYGTEAYPTNYLIDKKGRMLFNIGVVYQTVLEEVEQKIEIALAQR